MQVRNWFTNQRKRHWIPIKERKREPRTHFELLIARALSPGQKGVSAEEVGRVAAEEEMSKLSKSRRKKRKSNTKVKGGKRKTAAAEHKGAA